MSLHCSILSVFVTWWWDYNLLHENLPWNITGIISKQSGRSLTLLYFWSLVLPKARFYRQIPGLWFAALSGFNNADMFVGGCLLLFLLKKASLAGQEVLTVREGEAGISTRQETKRKNSEKLSLFFTLRAQKSILNSEVYQSKLSPEFTASLIFHIWNYFLSPHRPASTFPPAKTLKWNPASLSKTPRHIIKN